jgi:hypothetical protein
MHPPGFVMYAGLYPFSLKLPLPISKMLLGQTLTHNPQLLHLDESISNLINAMLPPKIMLFYLFELPF